VANTTGALPSAACFLWPPGPNLSRADFFPWASPASSRRSLQTLISEKNTVDIDIVTFLRRKDFQLKKELGRGACGQTVLLYDSTIDEQFVCKKYAPIHEGMHQELFAGFVREIKLLHLLHHRNVVRLFNYYLYPDKHAGYIVMEYVQGADVEDFLKTRPEAINEVFLQAIDGFAHLEANNILHRDIRPQNILVTNGGVVKIIDFGFGKRAIDIGDFGKSITLNWWCEPPPEFANHIYDFRTEVYFLGKLFQKILLEQRIEEFKHSALLARMCAPNPDDRLASFSDVRKHLLSNRFSDIEFDEVELWAYRQFSDYLSKTVSKIERQAKYFDDAQSIQDELESRFKKVMLEEYVPSAVSIVRCFVNGEYYYNGRFGFPVSVLKAFIELLRASSREKKNVILSNLQSRLDAVSRYDVKPEPEEDVPF
jgi:eukaryotic-like serine/threonine-protein kinase